MIVRGLFLMACSSSGQSIKVKIPATIQPYQVILVPADDSSVSAHINNIAGADADKIKALLP
jgi:hypothetical protein